MAQRTGSRGSVRGCRRCRRRGTARSAGKAARSRAGAGACTLAESASRDAAARVSANGVGAERRISPPDAPAIARVLIARGADPHAPMMMNGNGSDADERAAGADDVVLDVISSMRRGRGFVNGRPPRIRGPGFATEAGNWYKRA